MSDVLIARSLLFCLWCLTKPIRLCYDFCMGNMKCRQCGSHDVVKNGKMKKFSHGILYRVQMYRCNNCGRQMMVR